LDEQNRWPDWVRLLQGWQPAPQPRVTGEIQRWPVYRETARFKRLAGYLEGVFRTAPGEAPPLPAGVPELLKKIFQRRTRVDEKHLLAALAPAAAALATTPDDLARRLLAGGWLGRWVRLQADEKSISSVEYGPLAPLTGLLQYDMMQLAEENRRWLGEMYARLAELQKKTGTSYTQKPDDAKTTRRGREWPAPAPGHEKSEIIHAGPGGCPGSPSLHNAHGNEMNGTGTGAHRHEATTGTGRNQKEAVGKLLHCVRQALEKAERTLHKMHVGPARPAETEDNDPHLPPTSSNRAASRAEGGSRAETTAPPSVPYGLFPRVFHPLKPRGRFHLAVEFLLALAECVRNSPEGFDWKEIGARFTRNIGGSKRFDAARDELAALAEAVTGSSLEQLGLTSSGSLYCIYFLGRLQAYFGPEAVINSGPGVNALTNVQMERLTGLATTARRVLLTENRALLLKMAAAEWEEMDPPALVLGIDGRLRLAHARFLKVLAETHPSLPWFAWVDTDEAGLTIAGQIAAINPRCRFLLPAGEIVRLDFAAWRRALEEDPALRNREQEDTLGHPSLWQEWFRIQSVPPAGGDGTLPG